ncbi:hypothetical protein B5J93_11610 [Moraxella equi]|uniref:Uncharacterized protein n=1 Tax=Moraxella equi TaxID=60442 RepID=A0ABX3NFD3_9GAMM|nr:hypothetical protein B5J93_11610 [Moraxella equi]
MGRTGSIVEKVGRGYCNDVAEYAMKFEPVGKMKKHSKSDFVFAFYHKIPSLHNKAPDFCLGLLL